MVRLLAVILFFALHSLMAFGQTAIVNAPNDGFLALRSKPTTQSGIRIAKIPHGAQLTIGDCAFLSAKERWCKTAYQGQAGWVLNRYLVSGSQGRSINLDKQQQKQLADLFNSVSRLCEAEYFKAGALTNDELITYGVVHSTGSNFAAHPDQNGRYRLPASYVDQVAMQCFGRKVHHKSVLGFQYKNGDYLAHVGDAGEVDRIEITNVESQEGDIYLVFASYFTPDENKLYSKKKALVKRIDSGGRSRFVMLEFQEDEAR